MPADAPCPDRLFPSQASPLRKAWRWFGTTIISGQSRHSLRSVSPALRARSSTLVRAASRNATRTPFLPQNRQLVNFVLQPIPLPPRRRHEHDRHEQGHRRALAPGRSRRRAVLRLFVNERLCRRPQCPRNAPPARSCALVSAKPISSASSLSRSAVFSHGAARRLQRAAPSTGIPAPR